jgi:glycine/D-amino acid oxidase-like deaminating enzyme
MQRRSFLQAIGGLGASAVLPFAAALAGEKPAVAESAADRVVSTPLSLPRVRASTDRIISLTVCTRPFRESGPRIESEKLGKKTVVHNYGHGGSGWSLSWGSGQLAVDMAAKTGVSEVAVIGCGALGLTSALLAQRAGMKVRIYAKELPPYTRSTFATGSWTPNSRFCTEAGATREVVDRWVWMVRHSHRMYQNLLGLPGDPIEWRDSYQLSERPFDPERRRQREGEPRYPDLEKLVEDLKPKAQELAPGSHPFPVPYVRRQTNMIFNISSYARMLYCDFLLAGGSVDIREFNSLSELARLKEKIIINATGYGARALFGDESIIPVRGQLMRLVPQPEITYGLSYESKVSMTPRRDGLVVQTNEKGDFNNTDATPDRAAAERSVQLLASIVDRMA